MTIDTKDLINSILESVSRIDYISPEDIPNIDLYMDQVTTFMDEHLKVSKRYPEDKILTKTMINNYAKNHLLPAPEKKKYSKEHLLLLIFIYYFKNIISIGDIETMLNPITEKYFKKDGEIGLKEIYSQVFSMEKDQIEKLKESLLEEYQHSQKTFEDVNEEDRELLNIFSFICTLSFDIYVKKQIVERLIDSMKEKEKGKKK
ncbi:MAG TPA: DUF1836 domain-containing protein [Lachnospiraceae bacterium]